MKILVVLILAAVSSVLVFAYRQPQVAGVKAGSDVPVRPVIVELFTSEGCSSCPPADALLAKLDQQARLGSAEIIALEEHVDYWDQLGWRDPYSSSQWTERQQDYAAAFRNDGVYTPQMVVDGRTEFVGSSTSKAKIAIEEAAREPKAEITLKPLVGEGGKARIGIDIQRLHDGGKLESQVWLAITENGLHSNVLHGENAGEDLHHAAVVRSLRKVGAAMPNRESAFAGEQELRLDSGWKKENLRVVVFVQDPKSKHILGAASVRLQP